MTFSHLPAAFAVLALLTPTSLFAQEEDASEKAKTCMLMGTPFTKGATVRLTGERVRCSSNEEGFFWNRDVDNDENRKSFVFCVFNGNFYSQGSVVGDVACNGNGNWD